MKPWIDTYKEDELNESETNTFNGIMLWTLCLVVALIAGCMKPAQAESLKDIVKRQIKGSQATVSEITVRKFSDSDVQRINKARAQLKGVA